MTEIKNSSGKLVCRLDAHYLIVEIVHRGVKTIIRIVPDGKPVVVNIPA